MDATEPTKVWGEAKSSSSTGFCLFVLAGLLIRVDCFAYTSFLAVKTYSYISSQTPERTFLNLNSKDGVINRESTTALRQHEQLSISELPVQDGPPPAFVPAAYLHRRYELRWWSQWRSVPHIGWGIPALWTLHSHRCIQVEYTSKHIATYTHSFIKNSNWITVIKWIHVVLSANVWRELFLNYFCLTLLLF